MPRTIKNALLATGCAFALASCADSQTAEAPTTPQQACQTIHQQFTHNIKRIKALLERTTALDQKAQAPSQNAFPSEQDIKDYLIAVNATGSNMHHGNPTTRDAFAEDIKLCFSQPQPAETPSATTLSQATTR
ncbi:MAG: hypothetical protein H6922_01495 [Pseudomonadaceae bacterium]|nr:hypothetical protein [Pseudomonadaceae bacterium]